MALKKKPHVKAPTSPVVEEVAEDFDIVTVVSTAPLATDGGSVVVLWEKNNAHPGGEAFIAGDTPVRVALTPTVQKLITDGRIEEVAE